MGIRRFVACLFGVVALGLAGCGAVPVEEAALRLPRARAAWSGDWQAVWQIEWRAAPVGGPIVAEMWHGADGRLRIETLEAPVAALNGLTLVSLGERGWLYDLRLNQAQLGARAVVRIPLADDVLAAMDWLLSEAAPDRIGRASRDELESGPAWRLQLTTSSGDGATLWLDEETDLPAGFELPTGPWGEARCVARRLERPGRLDARLFDPQPPPGAVHVGSTEEAGQEFLPGLGD